MVMYFAMPVVPVSGNTRHRLNVFYAMAFEKVITGRVTGEDGTALPGATVIVKGTGIGTTTDSDGRFSLSVPDNAETLVISFVGYMVEEVVIGSQTVVNVTLRDDQKTLSEVLVVGLWYAAEK